MEKLIKDLTYEEVRTLALCKNKSNFLHLPETIKLLYFRVSNMEGGHTFRTLMFTRYLKALENELTSSILERKIEI